MFHRLSFDILVNLCVPITLEISLFNVGRRLIFMSNESTRPENKTIHSRFLEFLKSDCDFIIDEEISSLIFFFARCNSII